MRAKVWIAAAVTGLGATAAALVLSPELHRRFEARAAAPDTAAVAPRVVMVTTARFRADRPVRNLSGTIAARTEADLAFRVGGKVLVRSVSVGDSVRAGEVVAALDQTDLRLQLEAAEAERAAARIALEKAQINLSRVTALESKGWASGQASDVETVAVEEARARLLQAERNAELAANQLGYATLRADADGVVTETTAEPGQVLAAGQPVVRVARAGGREAVVAVPEAMLDEIRDTEALVELWSEPGRALPATLRELSPIADDATRTFEARYTLQDAGDAALGMSVTVALASPAAGASAELPLAALFDAGAGPVVWIVGPDGRLSARPVTVADYDGTGQARIVAGLADGERVVVLGANKLQQGEAVRAVEAEG